jgi:hypothetical protein
VPVDAPMKFLPVRETYNIGDRKKIETEETLEKVDFTVHKFSPRPRPDNRANVVIFPNFAEFGSELIESIYCVPFLMNGKYKGKYSVVMGWHGRAHLYKHLVDEYWEMKPEHMWLRDYARAFHHTSKNLKSAEKAASAYGKVVNVQEYGVMAVYNYVHKCKKCDGRVVMDSAGRQVCLKCLTKYPPPGFYNYVPEVKKRAVWPPLPSQEKLNYVFEKYLKGRPRPVGITARGRRTYSRNLPPEYYIRLVKLLEERGYTPVWLGEKESIIPCPCDHILDFSTTDDAADLENTLALVFHMKFTVQFWTASTRLAGLVGTPFLLFESPDQVYGLGQEGYRMNLCSRGPYKLVLSHFWNVFNDQDAALKLVDRAVTEMEASNYKDIVGMVENVEHVNNLRISNSTRIGK